MADWFYIGYCTVMAMFAVAAAYAAVVGLRALRRLPRSLLESATDDAGGRFFSDRIYRIDRIGGDW